MVSLAEQIRKLVIDDTTGDYKARMEQLEKIANRVEALEGGGHLLDIVAERAYATENISLRAYTHRAPSLWFSKTVVGMDEDLPLFPVHGFTGKPFVAMNEEDYLKRLKELYDNYRIQDGSLDRHARIMKVNEISALISEAAWNFVRGEDETGYTNLLGADAELGVLLNKEDPAE